MLHTVTREKTTRSSEIASFTYVRVLTMTSGLFHMGSKKKEGGRGGEREREKARARTSKKEYNYENER